MAPLGDIAHVPNDVSDEFGIDSCKARDEAADLRNDVCQLRVRLEEVEDERNFNTAKANELEEVIRAFKQEYVHEELVKKSLQLAETSMTLDSLQSQIKNMQDEKVQLLLSQASYKKKMKELSNVIRSLQCSDDESSYGEEKDEVVLTPEKALDMTLKNMKAHIEFLEDELQARVVKCAEQDKTIAGLEKENEMTGVKIEMLEQLFRSLNDERHVLLENRHSPTPRQPASTSSVQSIKMARSWDNLLGKDLKSASTSTKRDRRTNQRAASSRNLTGGGMKRSMSPRSPGGKSKTSTVVVGDQEGSFVGTIVDGKPNGVGTVRFSNGDMYLGELRGGKLHGKGSLYSKESVLRGSFQDNVFLG